LREKQDELDRLNVKVVVVTFEKDFLARRYAEATLLPWPILIDTTRDVYRGYGMLKASCWDVWGIKTWLAYFRELLKGKIPLKSEGDLYQRGGDVIIDPGGIIRLHHVGRGPADRPTVRQIMQVIDPGSVHTPLKH